MLTAHPRLLLAIILTPISYHHCLQQQFVSHSLHSIPIQTSFFSISIYTMDVNSQGLDGGVTNITKLPPTQVKERKGSPCRQSFIISRQLVTGSGSTIQGTMYTCESQYTPPTMIVVPAPAGSHDPNHHNISSDHKCVKTNSHRALIGTKLYLIVTPTQEANCGITTSHGGDYLHHFRPCIELKVLAIPF